MELSEADLKHLQAAERSLLNYFDEICKKLSIVYFACGGTLLGAIRHKGFIPWDDDIDVMVGYDDYQKLITMYETVKTPGYSIEIHGKFPDLALPMAKIVIDNSAFVEKGTAKLNLLHGIWLDVFPLVAFPENRLKQEKLNILCKAYCHQAMRLSRDQRKKGDFLKDVVSSFLTSFRSYRNCAAKLLSIIDETNRKYKKSKYVTLFFYGCSPYEAVSFKKGHYSKFDDTLIFIPDDYEDYLQKSFGDYMTLPPLSEQKGHHSVEYFSLTQKFENPLTKK